MTTNAEISTGLEEIKQMLLGMQQRNKEFWDEQVIQIRSLRHTLSQAAGEHSRLQTLMAEPTQEIENSGSVETPHDKAKEDDYDAPADKEAADEDGKVVVEPATPVMAVFKVPLILQYNCSTVEKISEYVELHPPPLVHSLKTIGNYCMPSVCGNVTVKCNAYSVSSLRQRIHQNPLYKLSVQYLLEWVAKPPLPPEIALCLSNMVLGVPFSSKLEVRRVENSVGHSSECLGLDYIVCGLKIATKDFYLDNLFEEGRFGSVREGWVDEENHAASKPGICMVIAIIKFNHESCLQGHKEWLAQVNFLGQLYHPDLVKLFGYSLEDGQRLLIYEFMHGGSLGNHLFMFWLFHYSSCMHFPGKIGIEIFSSPRPPESRSLRLNLEDKVLRRRMQCWGMNDYCEMFRS